jgi:beta-galactosidase
MKTIFHTLSYSHCDNILESHRSIYTRFFQQSVFRTILYHLLVILLVVLSFQPIKAQVSASRLENINQGWNYLENESRDLTQIQSQNVWELIDLPHTWNSEDVTDLVPGYRRSASWYSKELSLSPDPKSRYFLYYECANAVADIYVNGQLASTHIGGYVGFDVEITKYIKKGQNVIHVRVDNSYNPEIIPSQRSDFFLYGGLTRDVWLKTVPETFLSDVNITTPNVSAKSADTHLMLKMDGNKDLHKLTARIRVFDPSGEMVLEKRSSQKAVENELVVDYQLNQPKLWSTSNPQLYKLEVALMEGTKELDVRAETYGYRWFEFKDHGPFYLNGERLLLRGTHRHEEIAGYGAAMPNELHRKDMEDIKEMGANFVRLGHYPQDPEVYKACDELGILIWDELPWCRGGVGNEAWKANTKSFLAQLIDQNINHPSVIIWSLGNEIYWLPEFEDGDNPDKINAFLGELNGLAHKMDPYRSTAVRKYYQGADIVDVFSPSIWSGWYSGTYKNYQSVVDRSIKEYTHFLHMEYGGSSHVGRHSENPVTGDGLVNPNDWEEPINQVEVMNIAQNGDWSENYIVDLFDWHLQVSETHPNLTGNAQWAFRDFGTPLRPDNDIPYMNQKGLTDRSGKPKDAYYVYKSYWSDKPTVYIESHTWNERSGPEKLAREISVYSNADSVVFFHNGKNLGFRKRDMQAFPACGLNWTVNFIEGQNDFRAEGYFQGKMLQKDSHSVSYFFEKSGTPEEIVLTYENSENGNYLVVATVRDVNGRRCLDYEERVYFQCLSGGKLNDNQGTPEGSSSIKMANGRAAIEVIPNSKSSLIKMTLLNQDFKGSFLDIPIVQTP